MNTVVVFGSTVGVGGSGAVEAAAMVGTVGSQVWGGASGPTGWAQAFSARIPMRPSKPQNRSSRILVGTEWEQTDAVRAG